jgi:hypothetical protein
MWSTVQCPRQPDLRGRRAVCVRDGEHFVVVRVACTRASRRSPAIAEYGTNAMPCSPQLSSRPLASESRRSRPYQFCTQTTGDG